MSLEQMAWYAAIAISIRGQEINLGVPTMTRKENDGVTLTYPDGQVFEVRVTMLHGIDKP